MSEFYKITRHFIYFSHLNYLVFFPGLKRPLEFDPADANEIKEPDLDGTTSSDDTLPSLPSASQSSQPSLEDDDRETITISSDEDLEDSM